MTNRARFFRPLMEMKMNHPTHTTDHTGGETPSFWRSRTGIGFLIAVAVGGFFLLKEHWVHAQGYLPYLLLLACPLMHLFMHGGHGGHGHGQPPNKPDKGKPDAS